MRTGDSYKVECRTVVDYHLKRLSVGGEEMPVQGIAANEEMKEALSEMNKCATNRYSETVLNSHAGKVTSRRRRYETIELNLDKLPTEHLIGKDVIIDRRDGNFSYSLGDGPELLGQDADWLRKQFERNKIELPDNWGMPTTPKKIGEEWTIDPADLTRKLAEDFEPDWKIDGEAAKASGVLNRVYRRNGALFGVTRFKIRVPYRELIAFAEAAANEEELKNGAPPDEKAESQEMLIEILRDQPIDGSSGPGQDETRVQMKMTKVKLIEKEVALKMQFDVLIMVHTKSTPVQ